MGREWRNHQFGTGHQPGQRDVDQRGIALVERSLHQHQRLPIINARSTFSHGEHPTVAAIHRRAFHRVREYQCPVCGSRWNVGLHLDGERRNDNIGSGYRPGRRNVDECRIPISGDQLHREHLCCKRYEARNRHLSHHPIDLRPTGGVHKYRRSPVFSPVRSQQLRVDRKRGHDHRRAGDSPGNNYLDEFRVKIGQRQLYQQRVQHARVRHLPRSGKHPACTNDLRAIQRMRKHGRSPIQYTIGNDRLFVDGKWWNHPFRTGYQPDQCNLDKHGIKIGVGQLHQREWVHRRLARHPERDRVRTPHPDDLGQRECLRKLHRQYLHDANRNV